MRWWITFHEELLSTHSRQVDLQRSTWNACKYISREYKWHIDVMNSFTYRYGWGVAMYERTWYVVQRISCTYTRLFHEKLLKDLWRIKSFLFSVFLIIISRYKIGECETFEIHIKLCFFMLIYDWIFSCCSRHDLGTKPYFSE